MLVVDAVQRDLEAIAKRAPELAESAVAALALTLAAELDDKSNSATSKSMCARVLADTLAELRDLAPVEPKKDKLDDLSSRRAARIAGGAGA